MEINKSIGLRLHEERERIDKTQSEFAGIAMAAGVPGATRQSQAKYEKGLATPSAAYMAAIAAAGVDVLYVLTGTRSGTYASLSQVRAAQGRAEPPDLSKRAAALLANYEATDEDGKRVIESTASFAAQPSRTRRTGSK